MTSSPSPLFFDGAKEQRERRGDRESAADGAKWKAGEDISKIDLLFLAGQNVTNTRTGMVHVPS